MTKTFSRAPVCGGGDSRIRRRAGVQFRKRCVRACKRHKQKLTTLDPPPPRHLCTIIRYWDYYEKVLAGPRPLLAPAGMLLADNVLFHELVPLAEAMGTAAAAAATATAAGTVASQKKRPQDSAGRGKQEVDPSAERRKHLSEREISPQERENKPLGGGVLVPTPRRLKIAESLDGFNKRVREDERVEVLMLPLRDGLSVVTWRTGGYPCTTGAAGGKVD